MVNSSSLSFLLSNIKISLAKKQLVCKSPYSKLNINILKILYSEGFIRGYKVDNKLIYVYLKFNQYKPVISDLAFFPSRNKRSYFSYNSLVSLYGFKSFGIVSTDVGLLTLTQCFLYKKGGYLLLIVT